MKTILLSLAFYVLLFAACTQVDEHSGFDKSAPQSTFNISLSEINKIHF